MDLSPLLTVDNALRVAAALSTAAGAYFAVRYQRELKMEAAVNRRAALQAEAISAAMDTISALNTQMRLLEITSAHHSDSLAECERQRRAAEAAVARWNEFMGNVWISEGADGATSKPRD